MVDKSIYNISHAVCSGCKMCGDICPKEAITFAVDKGFWYPKVNDKLCINCGLCSKKCPSLKDLSKKHDSPVVSYGAKTKKEDIRKNSTSGGFFSELAEAWISDGGYCIGAIYGEDNRIVHTFSNRSEDILRFRQSKYAQSDTAKIYKEAKQLLVQGEKVLFCGTPCHVEALYLYLGKTYDNLLTMDFVCLGICSPWVYRKYLDMLENRYRSKVVKVWFKNKKNGWRAISTRIDFANGKTYLEPGNYDLFMIGFVIDALSMRPNCQNCRFRKIPHISDFTVADFWGIEKIKPEADDNKGFSAVFVNTDKGIEWFGRLSNRLDYIKTTTEDICRGNFSVYKPMEPNPKAEDFMNYLENHSFNEAMSKYSSFRGLHKFRMMIRKYKQNLLLILKS